ncbi:uncharacterized protein [Battus philenor]|uniref:uncharacterized protein n=1 Tax=Battus philenor TaxID=42288 RepID=UPI0035CFF804
MEELCTSCLCVGRNLFFIGETGCYNLYYQILNEIEVYDTSVSVRVCWECRAAMRRFQRFKEQAQRCYTELLQHVQQNDISKSISRETNLKIQHVVNVMYPDTVVKAESDDDVPVDRLKSEVVESEQETHCEPETFVRNLHLQHQDSGKITKTRVKRKKKKRTKLKVNDFSDSENYVEDCDVNGEDDVKLDKLPEVEVTVDKHSDTEVLPVHFENGDSKTKPLQTRAPRCRQPLPDRPQCVECGKVFSSKKTYRYHLNVLHKGQNRYPCPRCGKVYQWKSNLGRHMRSHKARDSGELHCSPCDKLFASVATYRQHLRVSRRHVPETEFSFSCDECGKKFVNKTRLRDHVDWEHLKKIKFRCHICNKPYKCHTSLYVHMQNVHRNKDAKDNLCHVCGKSYQNAAKLKYHIVAMHTSETPYQCERCSASFGWYSSLYRHVREVHYKMKVQPKKSRKGKKLTNELVPPHAQPLPPALPGPL